MMFVKFKQKIKSLVTEDSTLYIFLYALYRKLNSLKRLKGSLGTLPDFLIVGVQKGGTSSLYHYLIQHPHVLPASNKETCFFSGRDYHKGLAYYRSFFPFAFLRKFRKFLTGEASTSYMIMPFTAKRVKEHLPNVKIIAVLRNPIERAYSNYCHEKRQGVEDKSFEEAIRLERIRTQGERDRVMRNPDYKAYNYGKYSYISRGFYYRDLKPWFDHFEDILVLSSEKLFADPIGTTNKIYRFLGLKNHKLKKYDIIQEGTNKDKIDFKTRKRLQKVYEPHNEKLFRLIGRRFDWR